MVVNSMFCNPSQPYQDHHYRRHCEESDDEAIQKPWIAALPLDGLGVARNDGCEGLPCFLVTLAKAGVQVLAFLAAENLDSRLRGNDRK